MSTRILDKKKIKDLQPGRFLWAHIDSGKAPHRFRAKRAAKIWLWQKIVRKALMDQMGFQDAPRVPLAPKRIERVDRGDFIREKILIRTSPWSVQPVYLLLPAQDGERSVPGCACVSWARVWRQGYRGALGGWFRAVHARRVSQGFCP